ncbi:MAG: HEAT repeat domain-containing protein [Phycisphaerales bacterium]
MATQTIRYCCILAVSALLAIPPIMRAEENAGDDVQKLIQALQDKDAMVRLRAARSLGELGAKAEPALDALKKALEDEDEDVRIVAKRAIERIQLQGNPELNQWIADLKDPDAVVRLRAAKALGDLGGAAAPALAALEQALADEDEDVRRVVQNAIDKINSSGSPKVRQLIEQLRDKDSLVRLSAAKQLGDLGAEARPALDALKSVRQDDPDEVVRMVAKNALTKLEKAGVIVLDQGGVELTDAVKEIAIIKVERLFNPATTGVPGLSGRGGGMRFFVTLKNTGKRTVRIGALRVRWSVGQEEIHNEDVDGPSLPLLAGQTGTHVFFVPWNRESKWDRRTKSDVEVTLASPLELDQADRLKLEAARQECSKLQILNPTPTYALGVMTGDRFTIQNTNNHICKGVLIALRGYDRANEWVYSLLYYAPLVPTGYTHVVNDSSKTSPDKRPVVKLVGFNYSQSEIDVKRFDAIVLAAGIDEEELPR